MMEIKSMKKSAPKISIGIGIMILKNGKVLLGRRKGSHAVGEYAFPGGHLEHMESFQNCALREIQEECGIEVKNMRFQFLMNIKDYYPKHFVHIGLMADWKRGRPLLLEPNKCESWDWYDMNNLSEPLMLPTRQAIEFHQTNHNYLDA